LNITNTTALALLCAMGLAWANPARSSVIVTVSGNVAHAQISLGNGPATYDAEVTISFDTPVNLDPANLNLTAELVNPVDPLLVARLPGGISIDPAFPMMITIEPPDYGWLFHSAFDANPENGTGLLTFLNTYDIEIHTGDLTYVTDSPYRLLKAPVGGAFADLTSEVLSGSVRTRGREGAFSQFMIGKDSRTSVITMLPVAVAKLLDLELRIIAASLDDTLNGDLLGLVTDISTLLATLNLAGAIADLDQLIAEILAHAGIDIANQWDASHATPNDAGEILGLAYTLRYTLVLLQTAPLL